MNKSVPIAHVPTNSYAPSKPQDYASAAANINFANARKDGNLFQELGPCESFFCNYDYMNDEVHFLFAIEF